MISSRVAAKKLQLEHCCKKIDETPTEATVPLQMNAEIRDHPNLHLINHKKCGHSLTDKIMKGTKANVGEYPWMALLAYKSNVDAILTFNCGGSLISAKHVLTAAHCVRVKQSLTL